MPIALWTVSLLAAALLLLANKLSMPLTDFTSSHKWGLSHGEGHISGAGNKAQVSNTRDKAHPFCNAIMNFLLCDHIMQSGIVIL